MNRLEQHLRDKLAVREQNGILRMLPKQLTGVDFVSNDYLGLATSGVLDRLVAERHFVVPGSGSTGSRLLSGNSTFAEELEARIASFHRAEAALLFNSGYNANIGLIVSIATRDTLIVYDELCHASIIDGVRLSLAQKRYKFRHNDPADLEQKLKNADAMCPVIVIVESVYSMDGDMAPLRELAEICGRYDASLIVDEAHATGVFGTHGEGLVCALNLHDQIFARVHTFGKALGCHGAAVAGSNLLRQYLINFARPFIYTTALPGHSIATIAVAYDHLASDEFSTKKLFDNIQYFREKIAASGQNNWADSHSPIQACIIGEVAKAKAIAAALRENGYRMMAILSPTVPEGKERLRVCLHGFNTTEEIDGFFEVMGLVDVK